MTPRSGAWTAILPYAALLGAMLTLAAGTSFAKQLFPAVGAQGTTLYRVGFSALLLLAVWRPWRTRLGRADLIAAAMYGLVLGLMNLCFYLSLRTTPLGVAIAIEFLGPLAIALRHARRPMHFVWIALAAAGLWLILPFGGGTAQLDPLGVGFAAAAGVFWALYIILGKRTTHLPGGVAVALGMTTAAVVVAPFGLAQAGLTLLEPRLLVLGLVVAILSSAIPYSLEMFALKGVPARSFGVMLSVEPAIGALAGLAFLGESLSAGQWLAIVLVVVASGGTVLTEPRAAAADLAPPP